MAAAKAREAEESDDALIQPENRKLEARVLSDEIANILKNEPVSSIKHIKKGDKLLKVRNSGEYPRAFHLRDEADSIRYRSHKPSCTGSEHNTIDIADIVDIWEGCKTDALNKFSDKNGSSVESKCFSVIYGEDRETLDIEAPSKEVRDHWVKALRYLIAKYKAMNEHDTQNRWLRRYYKLADKNYDGVLSFDEICKLLEKLNVEMRKKDVRRLFDESADAALAKSREDDNLDFKAFAHFYRKLARRPEIEKIFARFAQGELHLTPSTLRPFLQTEQKETELSEEVLAKLIRKHEPIEENKRRGHEKLSIDGFINLLRGKYGDIFNHQHDEVTMDMSKSLSKYFIASSHNTYLTEHQLKGPASVEAYICVLEKGCRLVELDCYDGPDDDPKVTHGFTLTGAVKLRDVCDAIRDFAFKTSPYPVILSLENHCSLEQQRVMAHMFVEKFGDKLYMGPVADTLQELPSPEELKYKIILKNKRLMKSSETLDISDDEEEVERAADLDKVGKQILGDAADNDETDKPPDHQKAGKKQLAKELSNLARIVISKSFQGCDKALDSNHSGHISSLTESKCDAAIEECAETFMRFTNRFLTKVYPGAGRMFDSSNLRPYHYWPAGVQVVAMNYQYAGENMQLNQALFAQNGNCGYVPKPSFLTNGDGKYSPDGRYPDSWKRSIRITIISGQNLPKPPGDGKDIVDPYVKVKMYGVDADRQMGKTCTIKNNGLNPEWSQQFVFHAHVPDLALLRFVVKDEDKYSKDDFIGQYSIAVNSLKQGFRHVHLRDKKDRSMAPASLFVHIKIR